MDDTVLTDKKFEELLQTRERMFESCKKDCAHKKISMQTMDGACECLKKFKFMFKYLKSNIPKEDLESFMEEAPKEKVVREIDPVTMESSEPFDGYEERFNAAGEEIAGKFIDDGYSLLFFGANGSGKTHTATWLACTAIENDLSVYYTYMRDLYSIFLNVEYGKGTEDDRRFFDYIINTDLLVIDEMGKETHSEALITFVEMLLKKRQSQKKSTIVVTNLDLFAKEGADVVNQILKRYGNSVWDLFKKYFVFQFARSGNYRAKVRKGWEI